MIPGFRIIVSHPMPRMQLSEKVPVTDEFRADMNLWMRHFFGMAPPIVERGETYVSEEFGIIVFHHDDYARLQKQTSEKRLQNWVGLRTDSLRNNNLWGI